MRMAGIIAIGWVVCNAHAQFKLHVCGSAELLTMEGIRASIRHVQFAAAKYRASAIAAPKISRGTCRGNIACEYGVGSVPVLDTFNLPRQSIEPQQLPRQKLAGALAAAISPVRHGDLCQYFF